MRTIYLILFSFFILSSCSEDDESTTLRQLSEFERNIIPFEASQTLEYTNESSETITANVTSKKINNSFTQLNNGPVYEIESASNSFLFETREEEFSVNIIKTSNDNVNFFIATKKSDNFIGILNNECSNNDEITAIESKLTDLTVYGFNYENVFRFQRCEDNASQDDLNVVQILYSVENGIEFIEYDDGTFLRQITE